MKSTDNPNGSPYRNNFTQDEVDSRIWSICTEPKFGIGQRCILLQTGKGNVLWDLITLLDQETIDWVGIRYEMILREISYRESQKKTADRCMHLLQ